MKNIPVILKMYKLAFLLLFMAGLGCRPCNGQDKDSVKVYKDLKNTVKINLTNPLIFGTRFNVIGYERVITDYQTITVSVGRFAFPKFSFINTDSLSLERNYKDKGFNFSIDYRFYLKKENRNLAPRGVYIGPYYAYNYFSRVNHWQINTANFEGDLDTKLQMNMHSLGFQLGYQFVFWNRVTLDLILAGPAVWFFNLEANVSTSLDATDESLLFEKLNDALHQKFPNSSMVIDGGSFKKKGSFRTNTIGYRYMFNIGFRF
jgi:hypothetical protein